MILREIRWRAEETSDDVRSLIGIGGGADRALPHVGVPALMLAVLDDAVRAYLGPVPRSRAEAECWVADARGRTVFSFITVCETLGLEPSAVRAALRRMRRGTTVAEPVFSRVRPNVRQQAGRGIASARPRRAVRRSWPRTS